MSLITEEQIKIERKKDGSNSAELGSDGSGCCVKDADEVAKMVGVREDIWYIRGEMEMMKSFLIAAEARENDNVVVRTWIRQVKDLAYQIEDCLEEFSLHLENRSLFYRLRTLSTRRRIASNIRDIRAKVQEVSQRNLRYNLIKLSESSSNATFKDANLATRMDALVLDETEFVGQVKPKEKLIGMITEENKHLKVIWITGMGGLGKTTLAKKVFDSPELRNNFPCRAWVSVSQNFDLNYLLRKILKQISEKKDVKTSRIDDLIECMRSQLEKSVYLVVLDDLWTTQAWDIIKNAFPDNRKGSRVIVTTRRKDVAEQCSQNLRDIYPLNPLSDLDACDLLLRKIYKSHDYLNKHKDLDDVTKKIIKKCGGLPLAIVTIGGLLATKPINKEEWDNLVRRLGSELETNPSTEAIKEILNLSYYDLPYYLKPCLLYVSIFPEDFEIRRSRLIYRWMAEGFVRPKRGMTLEEVAEEYFYELINRNLIQPSIVTVDETIRYCRVHDIMRELIVAKSIEENLVFIMGEQENMKLIDNFRHLAITGSNEIRTTNLHGIRSVSIFHAHVPSVISSPSKLKLVKILDLDDTTILYDPESSNNLNQVIRHLGQFKHLKSVFIPRYMDDIGLPNSLGNLRDLQTLEMRSEIRTMPKNIIKLHNLRHLLIGGGFGYEGVAMPKGIGNLKELQVLKWVDLGRSHRRVVGELAQLRQLRKLTVYNLGRGHYEKFSASISELTSLRSLTIRVAESEEAAAGFLDSVSSPPEHLRSIKLEGWIGKLPVWVSSLYNLAMVSLLNASLNDAAIVVLQELPNVLLLKLWANAYAGTRLTFRSAKFSKLKQLDVAGLENLEELVFEEDTSPELQTLGIAGCELKSGISGAEHLPKLKKITLGWSVYVANLDEVQGQVGEHPNHPALEIERPDYQKEREDFYREQANQNEMDDSRSVPLALVDHQQKNIIPAAVTKRTGRTPRAAALGSCLLFFLLWIFDCWVLVSSYNGDWPSAWYPAAVASGVYGPRYCDSGFLGKQTK
ncbi:hypothetical protein LUZ63_005097 [Rhynchospora breviuscula]|uniref:Uncharacterized protein n=1 Tax=Rhynchospora breviuscula TaxID=2022672 RepID=A0A9Q0HSQ8_9POAL|nr:hypothetical protein LUZ63_005097 [Rhynchospora breviuscula]